MASAERAAIARCQWQNVLDELERFVGDLIPGADTAPWKAPERLGPLPPELVGRAHKILAGQKALVRELEAAQQETGRHLVAVRAVTAARDTDASVYVDVMS